MANFPLTLAAIRKVDGWQWNVGEALVRETDESPEGKRSMTAVVEELTQHGFDYGLRYLHDLKATAMRFPKAQRHDDISWKVHEMAGNPEVLDALVTWARRERQKLSMHYVAQVLAAWRRQEMERWKAEREAAAREATHEREAAEKAERDAQSKAKKATNARERAEAERARAKAKEAKHAAKAKQAANRATPTWRNLPPPPVEGVSALAAQTFVVAKASESVRYAKEAKRRVGPAVRRQLSPAALTGMHDASMKAAAAWNELAATLLEDRETDTATGHLRAVN
jgi:flagellar biosynthesis GTPase FlhF